MPATTTGANDRDRPSERSATSDEQLAGANTSGHTPVVEMTNRGHALTIDDR